MRVLLQLVLSIAGSDQPAQNSSANAVGAGIEIGIRATGSHRDETLPLQSTKTVRLDDIDLLWMDLFDAQVGATRPYYGISLTALLELYPAARRYDLALLHFDNGMIVPVPLADGRDQVGVFVARAMRRTTSSKIEDEFPDVAKNNDQPDPRPITFGTNKVVVPTLEEQWLSEADSHGFSPWLNVNTLTEIELAHRESWERQFDVGQSVRAGRDVFLRRCQFCHGVGEVGAKFGWDFVKPIPLFIHRAPRSLYPHVRFQNILGAERGAMMPAQKDVEPAEIEALWLWMKEISAYGPAPYAE